MKIKPKSRLLMIGDSITDAGRARPVGEVGALGDGYVNLLNSFLTSSYPAHLIRVLNTGISGNTVRHLKARWQTDVLDLKPDWLSIMIGTNDVWRQFDQPQNPDLAVGPEEYEQTLDELVGQTKARLQGLVLMTPFYLDPNPQEPMRARMDQYGAIVKKLAAKHGALFVDTQAAYDVVLKQVYTSLLAADRVHTNQAGSMILARAFLNAIGFEE